MTRVAILWHMHQPYYEDLLTREHILPWVRLHALKDYWGMVALLDEFPNVRVTFNLVPSLLVQLEAFAEERAYDRFLDVGMKPAGQLTDEDTRFMLRNFFHAQRQRMIDIYPRYAELLALRGRSGSDAEVESAAGRFTTADLLDLQVWQKLAWIDPDYLQRDPRVRALVARGRGFTEEDKRLLRDVELELLKAVIPAYRAAGDSGRVELSSSPFYHPILPLLCDTDVYARMNPGVQASLHRFARPEDALEQLEQAAACHERLFGRRPIGLWPSEGSVSDAIVPLVARSGFQWMATDELVLAKTIGVPFHRDKLGFVERADRLYRPYRLETGGRTVACGFRDHALSDLIGFVYAGWSAEAAAEDFVRRLTEAGRQAAAQSGGGEPTIFIILDGENAWEHFEGGGRPFLRALYGRLAAAPELQTVTMAEACEAPADVLHGIFPGSWIDASFDIWIGHADDHRAWRQLAEARDVLDTAGRDVDPATLRRARQEVLIAEGSDWCWWYGDDHSSEHDTDFDELYRRHLRNVYRLLQQPIPDDLFVSNITTGRVPPQQTAPTSLLRPTLDGEDTSYFEWLGAGTFMTRTMAGAMHQAERRVMVTGIRFGFDERSLYLRVDGASPAVEWLGNGLSLVVTFLQPAGVRAVIEADTGQGAAGSLWHKDGAGWVARRSDGLRVSAGAVVEVAVALSALSSEPLAEVAFFVTVVDGGVELERHPASRPLEVSVPDAWFAARNWTV